MALIKNSIGELIKMNGNLLKTSDSGKVTQQPGIYDADGNLLKTWDQLIEEGLVTVE